MPVSLQTIKGRMSLTWVHVYVLKQMVSIKSAVVEVFGSRSAGFVGNEQRLDGGKLQRGALAMVFILSSEDGVTVLTHVPRLSWKPGVCFFSCRTKQRWVSPDCRSFASSTACRRKRCALPPRVWLGPGLGSSSKKSVSAELCPRSWGEAAPRDSERRGCVGLPGGRAGGVGQTGCRNRQAPSAGTSFSLRWVPASQKIQLFLITEYKVCMAARFVVLFSVLVRWSCSGSISVERG